MKILFFSLFYIEVPSQMINENNNNNQLNNFMPVETKLKISLPDIRKVPYLNISNKLIPNNNNINNKTNNLFRNNYFKSFIRFLNSINLKKYYKNLSTNCFDDINLIIEQTKENF